MRTPLDDMIASYLNFRDARKAEGKQLSAQRIITVIAVFLVISIIFGFPGSTLGAIILSIISVAISEYIGHYIWKHPERIEKLKSRFKF